MSSATYTTDDIEELLAAYPVTATSKLYVVGNKAHGYLPMRGGSAGWSAILIEDEELNRLVVKHLIAKGAKVIADISEFGPVLPAVTTPID